MNFCPVCDSLLQPKKVGGTVIPFCFDCKEPRGDGSLDKISIEDESRKDDPEAGKILIIEETSNLTVGRSHRQMFCSNCNTLEEVEYWEIQTRSADESPTRFFKCTHCDKNWREYD